MDTAKKFISVSLPSNIFLAKDKDECAKWKCQEMRDRIDNTCPDQKINARVHENLNLNHTMRMNFLITITLPMDALI